MNFDFWLLNLFILFNYVSTSIIAAGGKDVRQTDEEDHSGDEGSFERFSPPELKSPVSPADPKFDQTESVPITLESLKLPSISICQIRYASGTIAGQRGFMSMVRPAYLSEMETFAAVKIFDDDRHDLAIENEAAILFALSHPLIPKLIMWSPGAIAMEHFPGQSLQKIFEAGHGIDRKYIPQIIADLLMAINHMHEKGIGMFNLNPNKILVDDEGLVKLIGFGDARMGIRPLSGLKRTLSNSPYSEPRFRDNCLNGTPFWSEEAQSDAFKGCFGGLVVDYYSVGALLYRLLEGELPENLQKGLLRMTGRNWKAAHLISLLVEENLVKRWTKLFTDFKYLPTIPYFHDNYVEWD